MLPSRMLPSRMFPSCLSAAVVAALLMSAPCFSQTASSSVTVEHPWLRATPNGAKVAAGYAKLTNTGSTPDRLVGGSVPFAGRVEVHEMAMHDGVMTMRALGNGLEIPPGGSVELKPGGNHLMFQSLSAGLKEGQSVQGTLQFEKAGAVPVTFSVGGLGGTPPGASPNQTH